MLLSTRNGCLCHVIQSDEPGVSRKFCISCLGREKRAKEGFVCSRCKVGLYPGDETDAEKCSECQEESW